MQQDIVQQGIDLMIYGMGTVFVFLTILVLITVCMSRLMGRYFPESEAPVATAQQVPNAIDATTLAVIKAAIAQHRKR